MPTPTHEEFSMKNKTVKTLLLILMIAILASTLSACQIFDSLFEDLKPTTPTVDSVEIIPENGLQQGENGGYIAVVGSEFTLSAKVNEDAPEQIAYKWYLSENGQKTQVGDKKILDYTFYTYAENTYEFSVVANGVESSNKISVTLVYSEKLVDTGIVSTTHNIIDGAVQEFVDGVEEISLSATWNKDALPEDAEVSVAWTIGENPEVVSTDLEFVYTPTAVVDTYEIHLTLTYKDNSVKHTLKVVVIEGYSAVESATLILEEGATPFGTGIETQYLQLVNSEHRDQITVSLSTAPAGETDYNAPVTWIVRDRNGERVLEDTDREVTFEPAYGETMIKAVVGNVESKHIVHFAFTEADGHKYESYMNDIFVWVDGVENGYITDQTDLNRFVQYAFSTRKVYSGESGSVDGIFPFAQSSTYMFMEEADGASLNTAMHSVDESGSIAITSSWSVNTGTGEKFDYKLIVKDSSKFMAPAGNYSPATEVLQDETAIVHYKPLADSEKRTVLPVDDNDEYPYPITNSQMLYRVLGWGYKPTFDSSADSQKMKSIYDSIRQVAIDYMTDDMSDYKKTLIIYEWIAQNVDYDYAIVDATLEEFESLNYNAFSLEGVFTDADGEGNGQAVCDGRAKAFGALCGVEDITAVRVAGDSIVGGSSERHAWNKVLIDVNGDGKKEWFMCDTTWSDRSSAGDNPRVERLNKQYFLVTDEYIKNTHVANGTSPNPVCNTTFDYYANTVIENGDDDFDLFINQRNSIFGGSDELDMAVNYALDNGIMLEIKVSTSICKTANELRTLVLAYAKTSKVEIYTIASAKDYNIYTIIFD